MSNDCSNYRPYIFGNTRRVHHEFPLSIRSLPQRNEGAGTATSRLNGLVQEIQTLARELSQGRRRDDLDATDMVTQWLTISNFANSTTTARREEETMRYEQAQITRLRTRLQYLQNQPEPVRLAELLQLNTEIDALLRSIDSRLPAPVLASNLPTKLRMPTGSVIPTLFRTSYKEQLEKDFERSLEYVKVQRKILRAIEKHDTVLSARNAYIWTSNSVPKGQWPQPLQALRLCYYMRSLGYDTFANIKTVSCSIDGKQTAMIRLLVVNPNSEERGVGHDHLYWAQDVRTGEVIPKAYKLRLQDTEVRTGTRRPALTLHTGQSHGVGRINQQSDQRRDGFVQMRGGEAKEHHRYSLTTEELEKLQAERWVLFQERAQWVAEEAAATRVERLFDIDASADTTVEEITRHFRRSHFQHAFPGDVLSTNNFRAESWSATNAGIHWPETSRPQSLYHALLNTSMNKNRAPGRRNSI